MNQFVVIFALFAFTMGAPAPEESKRSLPALEHTEERGDDGQYSVHYVTAEGTVVSEHGRLVPTADGKDKVLVTDGEVSYVGPDGKSYMTKWSAGVEGVKAEGAHLPVAPEAPAVPEVPAVAPEVLAAEPEAEPAAEPEAVPAHIFPAPILPMLPYPEVLVFAY
ncbi:cuticle protein CP14.6-like [Amyelois transitella]|uniref:cuticle protein CP14.6-like n=1 Tax=Amyelois transitella TaxID=680683 RepID=UPI00067C58AC|nr:cuticle protein CP14.6-like [Amyelois transitella]